MPYIGDSDALPLPLRPTDKLLVERDGVAPLEAPVSALLDLVPTPTAEQVGAATAAQGGKADTAVQPAALALALADKADLVGGKLDPQQIPDIALQQYLGAVATEAAMLALVGQAGDWCSRTDTGTDWRVVGNPATLSGWLQTSYPSAPVSTVNGKSGAVLLTAQDVGAATAAQGSAAETAVQPGDLGPLATMTLEQAQYSVSGEPYAQKTRVLIVGSSNARGIGASTFENGWAGLLATAYTATHVVSNMAIPGRSIQYWIDQDINQAPIADGVPCTLEYWIRDFRPDIVIGAFTMSNSLSGSDISAAYCETVRKAFIECVKKAAAITNRFGAKYVGITPYIQNAYAATHRQMNRNAAAAIVEMGFPVIDFQSVFEVPDGQNIPTVIDSGDGQHVNDLGHLAQFYTIPSAVMLPDRGSPPRHLTTFAGTKIPNDTSAGNLLSGFNLGHGSWSIGFHHVLPDGTAAAPGVIGTLVTLAINDATSVRLRCPGGLIYDVTDTSATRGSALRANITPRGPTHWMLTYCKERGRMRWYQDGVLVAEWTPVAGTSFATAPTIAGSFAGFNNVGHRFAGVVLHRCELPPADVYRTACGEFVNRSVAAVWPLDDGFPGSKSAGDHMTPAYAGDEILKTSIAI